MKVFYYYYYLFYTKILPEQSPYATTTFALSISQSLFLVSVINIMIAFLFCLFLKRWEMIGLTLFILIINYWIFNKKGWALQIIIDRPKFFNSNKISIMLTILFFIITFLTFCVSVFFIKHILQQCG
jgi:hypothetical protein